MADEALVVSSGWTDVVGIHRCRRLVYSFGGRAVEAKVMPGPDMHWRLFIGTKPVRMLGGGFDFPSQESAQAQGESALREVVRFSSAIE